MTTLLYTDIQSHSESTQPQKLQWHPLLEPSIPTLSSNTACPRETQLLMERKRLSTWGITEYELHKKSGRIIFPAIGTLYQCIDTGYSPSPLFPSELRVCQLWTAIDPQICPHNSDLTAYVCGGDLWVTHAFSGHGERLTFAHDGRRASFVNEPLTAGVPSYVMQEEFNRYQGYWWQPNKSEGQKFSGTTMNDRFVFRSDKMNNFLNLASVDEFNTPTGLPDTSNCLRFALNCCSIWGMFSIRLFDTLRE